MLDETNVQEEEVVEETTEDELEDNDNDHEFTGADSEESIEESEEQTSGDLQGNDAERNSARDRATAQIDRLKKENRDLKEQIRKSGTSDKESGVSSDLVSRTFLSTEGYKNREIQDKAIERAERLGLSVDQLLADPDEKAVLDMAVKRITTTQASSRPTGKGGTRTRDAKWYVEKNIMPEDPKLVAEVWELLAEKDR